jgi:crotonobetainyl-CoA:carnitine CoA-transferase CaiB-like acyl-CoA transferase
VISGMTPPDGLLVADFSRVLAGPLATMTLADLGATVVKVERPGVGDETRTWGPPWTDGSSAYFDCVNRSKLGITLDLADDADRAQAGELARRADVVIHNLRGMQRFGLDYDAVAAGNPRVVYCSITGFGEATGRPGYDFLVQAVGGLMSITGDAGGEPRKVGVALVDVLTGKDAVIGILAALAARERTGRGDHVRVELLSSLLGGLVNQAAGFLATGTAPGRMGNQHPSIAPYETLHCADGLLAVACGNDGQFARLVATAGGASLAADPRFATNPARVANRPALIAALESLLAGDTAAAWEARFEVAGVPAGQVGDIAAAVERAEDYGLAPTVDVGSGRQIRHPVRYGAAGTAEPAPPPGLGEHDALVRAWLAGPPELPLVR